MDKTQSRTKWRQNRCSRHTSWISNLEWCTKQMQRKSFAWDLGPARKIKPESLRMVKGQLMGRDPYGIFDVGCSVHWAEWKQLREAESHGVCIYGNNDTVKGSGLSMLSTIRLPNPEQTWTEMQKDHWNQNYNKSPAILINDIQSKTLIYSSSLSTLYPNLECIVYGWSKENFLLDRSPSDH